MNWKKSIHSEVNDIYVSNPNPKQGESVEIKLSMLKNREVKNVYLRTPVNGEVEHNKMYKVKNESKECDKSKDGEESREGEESKKGKESKIEFYSVKMKLDKKYYHYHFIIELEDEFLYYTRKSITNILPTEDYDFVIICNFENPSWVPKSVFYQIFPDRFNSGDSTLGVKDSEYVFDGHGTIEMNWADKPLEYKDGHCLDFYNGDLKGIQNKINYFKDLGVNALYLNPIFSAKTTHRYDCTDYFSVDEHLGGNESLSELTEKLHENDMKVIVDVSINHTGTEHEWFKKALKDKECEERKYYYFNDDDSYWCWFGFHSLPQLNFNSEKLRDKLYKTKDSFMHKFLKAPYNIDGWRFDVGNHVGRKEQEDFCHEIWREVRKEVKSINNEAYILGEHWEDAISHLLGDEWDSPMNYFSCGKVLRSFMGMVDRRFWSIKDKKKKVKATTGYQLVEQINQNLSRIPNQIVFLQFNLIDSHDIFRLHNFPEEFDFELYRGLVSTMFILPGCPNIFYGDEIGLDGHLDSNEGIRYPMEWNQEKWDMNYFELYKKLSHLKKNEKVLHTGSYKVLFADEDSFAFVRFNSKKIIFSLVSRNRTKKIRISFEQFALENILVKELFTGKNLKLINSMLEINLQEISNGVFIIEK